MRHFLNILFFFCTLITGFSQTRPLYYFGQQTFGSGFTNNLGRGNVSTGNINGDSIADIAITGDQTYQIGLGKIENGQLGFDMQPIQFYKHGQFFYNGEFIDLTGDGLDEFIMRMHTLPTQYWTYIFDNQSTSLDTAFHLPTAPFPADTVVDFGHFNSDTIVDGYYFADAPTIIDGSTGRRITLQTPLNLTPKWVDFNQDGLPDFLYRVANSPNLGVLTHQIFINQGDYTFELYETSNMIHEDGYADFDGDGILDIVDYRGDVRFSIKSNLLSQDSAVLFEVEVTPDLLNQSHFYHDLDMDGFADILVFGYDSLLFLRNNQDKSFSKFSAPLRNPAYSIFTYHPSWQGNHIVAHTGSGAPIIYRIDFDGTTLSASLSSDKIKPPVLREQPYFHTTARVDLDIDNQPEIMVVQDDELLLGEWDGQKFGNYAAIPLEVSRVSSVREMTAADFNSDGLRDIVYSENNLPGILRVCYAKTDSSLSAPDTIAQGYNLSFLIRTADFDGNGYTDFIASGNSKTAIFFNQNGAQFTEQQLFGSRTDYINLIDPNKDGVPDLAASAWGDSTHVYMNDGQGNFSHTLSFTGGPAKSIVQDSNYMFITASPFVSLIEIDSDGKDFKVLGSRNLPVNFASIKSYTLDYNGDGIPDLIGNFKDTARIVLGDTTIAFGEVVTLPNHRIADVIDLDRDGNLDVLWQIGSQFWVEVTDTPIWTTLTNEAMLEPLNIFPNPTRDFLNLSADFLIKNPNPMKLQIWNSQGQLLHAESLINGQIDAQFLPRGSYFLMLFNDDGRVFGGRFVRM